MMPHLSMKFSSSLFHKILSSSQPQGLHLLNMFPPTLYSHLYFKSVIQSMTAVSENELETYHLSEEQWALAEDKGEAGFESAIWGQLVNLASRLLNFFNFIYQLWVIHGLDELRLGWCTL